MKIALLDVKSANSKLIYKDFSGGLGPGFSIGASPLARFLELAKQKGLVLPITSYGYLNAIFKNAQHTVEYAVNAIPVDADVVFIHSSLVDYKLEVDYARRIKAQYPRTRIGFIGPLSASMPELFSSAADFIIAGEPEAVALKIAAGYMPQGIVQSEPIIDLDTLPLPDWSFYPVRKTAYFPALKTRPVLPIVSSRGCAYKCDYCPYLIQYNKWRCRSVDNVIAEIKNNIDKFATRAFLFRDPCFSFPQERAKQISESIVKNGLDIRWACETRLDCLSIPLLDSMYEAGLRTINVGIESVNKEIITKSSRKFIEFAHQEEIIAYCDRKGINVTAFYIIGWPDETAADVQNTIAYAKKMNTNIASFSIYTPYPGTPIYKNPSLKFISDDISLYDAHHLVFEHAHFTPEALYKIKKNAFVSYYFRPRYIASAMRRFFKR